MSSAGSCFHCGLPVPAGSHWRVTIDHIEQSMCCPGCQAVAQTIVDNGLESYYQSRTGFADSAQQAVPPQLRLYDNPELSKDFVANAGEEQDVLEAVFSVEGIRCAACVWLIERRIGQVPGVLAAELNVASAMLRVRWQQGRCQPSAILQALHEIGYSAYPFDARRQGAYLRRASRTLFRQLFVAGLSMMQVMMYAAPAYFAHDAVEADMASLMRWASLFLTLPAVAYSALPFFQGAWNNLKNRVLGMDVPVALGIGAGFLGSLHAMAQGSNEVYFDSVTMFIFLLLCSRYLELQARSKAQRELERLQHALPASAARLTDYPLGRNAEMIAASGLLKDDVILVKPGEAIAADCIVLEGASSIDASLLTGESRALPKQPGDILPGGAVNISQSLVARVTRPAQESTLSALVALVERAGQAKPQLSQWADRVSAYFVAALLLFAAIVFFAWQWIDPARAWPVAIAVLVVSCPCALSLATPTALAAATGRLLRQGVLVVKPHVLETLQRTTHVVLDKTGTLTRGKPALHHTLALGGGHASDYLKIAAALEVGSAHPLATAIVNAAGAAGLQAQEVQFTPGLGMEGSVNGVRYRLGSAAFVAKMSGGSLPAAAPGITAIYLASEEGCLARFDLRDRLREDAKQVVEFFKASARQVILLSGDDEEVTRHVAAELGITYAHGGCLPHEKLEFVQDLQKNGAVVAMAGDGINDAAVLSVADVSFAMGAGAMLAQTHADCVLLPDRLALLCEASRTAAQTMRVVRQNLGWAMAYNAVAIPAAAFGLLNPWLSAVGMSASSALVVLNAMRLRPNRALQCQTPKDVMVGAPMQTRMREV